MVSIQNEDGIHLCGGTILSTYAILTAAHCVLNWNFKSIRVVAGAHDVGKRESIQQRRRLVQITSHPAYNHDTHENDIAILRLESPLFFYDAVHPVVLRTTEIISPAVTLVGWGKSSFSSSENDTSILQQVHMSTWTQFECQEKYGDTTIHRSMLCAGNPGKDACAGDSGGPLLCEDSCGNEEQCGIVSFGVECLSALYPGVYTKVSHFIPWLIEQNVVCPPNQFMCHAGSRRGHCVPKAWRCNGRRDCFDGEDENYQNCLEATEATQCPQTASMCDYRINQGGKCVANRDFCDGIRDCDDGKDENCKKGPSKKFKTVGNQVLYAPCPCFVYTCDTYKSVNSTPSCVSRKFLCDGVQDCPEGDDENEWNCKNRRQRFREVSHTIVF